jgi:adenosine deaminase
MTSMRSKAAGLLLLVLTITACAGRTSSASGTAPPATGNSESATAAYMDSVRNDPGRLILFLREMPKGGDLHNHLGGGIYAESMIAWAGADGLCLIQREFRLKPPPCRQASGEIPASQIPRDDKLYGDVIDAWSMRNWDPARQNGHDQFFESFGKFSSSHNGRTGDMLAEVVSRAAEQHVSYMELMHIPDEGGVIGMSFAMPFDMNFAALRDRLLARGFRDTLQSARRKLDAAEQRKRMLLKCGPPPSDAGCAVTVRYLYQVLRGLPPQVVFAQILAGFEMTRMDPRVVGFNLVMPEDDVVPMRDFDLHMRMIDYLHAQYPEVKISLHAGELADGLVAPEGLRFHITKSIDTGHAIRIGHGTAVLHETNAADLLKKMADRKILVEIALSSSDAILGIRGKEHPINTYLAAGVPVALATDDEGVLRSNITREFKRAVEEQNLGYRTLKSLVRNSIVYAFVDDPTKARLLNSLDSSFVSFERRQSGRRPD